MLFGYWRRIDSEEGSDEDLAKALSDAGVEQIIGEKASKGRWDRPELFRALKELGPEDVLVVPSLKHLTRGIKDFLLIMEQIRGKGAGFRSLLEKIDTTSPTGKDLMVILSRFTEFEREMVGERVRKGIDQAKGRGKIGGRPPKLSPKEQKRILKLVQSGERSAADVARMFKIHPSTVGRIVDRQRKKKTD